MAADPLHLLRLDLAQPGLHGLARDHRLPLHNNDLGYVLHAAMAALFGDMSPKTFTVERMESSRTVRILAYSQRPLTALHEHATTYADPAVYRLCDWDRAADKPMPTTWREGQRLGFQVRVCPTVRMAKAGPEHRAGAEVDAFLAAAWRAGEGVKLDRETVYRDWLAMAFERSGGARLEVASIDNFHIEALLRRTQGEHRAAPQVRKPDVTLHGALTVVSPDHFDALLRRGVGRHRAFGFGMLMLRQERSRC